MSGARYADRPVRIGVRLKPQHADIWHGFGDLDALAHKNEVLDRWCAEVGREPAEIERSTAASEGPDAVGEALVAMGERLITRSTDGRAGFDLDLTRDWLQFRDEQNAQRNVNARVPMATDVGSET